MSSWISTGVGNSEAGKGGVGYRGEISVVRAANLFFGDSYEALVVHLIPLVGSLENHLVKKVVKLVQFEQEVSFGAYKLAFEPSPAMSIRHSSMYSLHRFIGITTQPTVCATPNIRLMQCTITPKSERLALKILPGAYVL